ncbi:TPA: hypothetical protein ACSPZY_004463, partial [Aeromonas veronii]
NVITNVITLTLKDKDGNAVPAGTPVKLSYAIATTPAFTPIITPANNAIATVNASGQVAVNIRSSTAGSVTLTNPAVVGGLPLVPLSASVNFTPPLINRFTKPPLSTYNWASADAYCRGLSPAARLPTRQELMDLFIDATSATAVGQTNYEMCDRYGWPLFGGLCDGSSSGLWASDPGFWSNGSTLYSGHYRIVITTGSVDPHNDANLY